MTKHTPGPWRVYDEFILAGGQGRVGRVIAAALDRVHFECNAENLANATLIARAPDLLADSTRLRELLREWIKVTCDYANLELVVVDSGLIERSKAAIGEGE